MSRVRWSAHAVEGRPIRTTADTWFVLRPTFPLSRSTKRLNAALAMIREGVRVAMSPSRRNLLHWLSFALALSVVLSFTFILADGRVYGWEQDVTRLMQAVDYPRWLFRITSDRLTNGEAWEGASIVASTAIVLWLLRQRVEAALVMLVLPLHVLGNFPKAIVERDRPSDFFEGIVGVGGGMSFPSGHAEFAITFYGFMAYLGLMHLRGRAQRVSVILVWLAFVVLVGFGRIAHGRHWPLDVLIGYVVGIGLLSGLIWLRNAFCRARRLAAGATTLHRRKSSHMRTSLGACDALK